MMRMRSRWRRESLQSQETRQACLTVLPRSSVEIKGFESQQINFAEGAGKRARRQGAGRKGDRFGEKLIPGRELGRGSWPVARAVVSCSGTEWVGEPRELWGEHPHQLRQSLEPNEARLRFRVVTVLLNWLSGSLCKASSAS